MDWRRPRDLFQLDLPDVALQTTAMSTTTVPASEPGLIRAIGVRGLTASIVNTTIGAGIFVLPALVARDLGSAAPLAYLACGLAMTFVVASFAMAGSRVSLTGGIYAYVEVAFGPLIGFLTGFLVWLSSLLAAASVASALAASVALVVPVFNMPIARVLGLGSGVRRRLRLGQRARRGDGHATGRNHHRGQAAAAPAAHSGRTVSG